MSTYHTKMPRPLAQPLHSKLCAMSNEVLHAAQRLRAPFHPEEDRVYVLKLREHMAQAIEEMDRFLDNYTPPEVPKVSCRGPTAPELSDARRLKRQAKKARVLR